MNTEPALSRSDLNALESGIPFDERPKHIQTHMSHVFLTTHHVYKFRKAVDLGFCDFRTRAQRHTDVLAELHLNRRLSPQVYLGIAAYSSQSHTFAELLIEPTHNDLPSDQEVALVMHRLAPQCCAKTMLQQGLLNEELVAETAHQLAEFHQSHQLRPGPATTLWTQRHVEPALENMLALAHLLPQSRQHVETATNLLQQFLTQHPAWFEQRLQNGRAVDGHGDLHLEHLWFPNGGPVWIDCLEFRDDFRQTDCGYDIGFLAMDLVYRGHAELADALLEEYAMSTLDYDLFTGIRFCMSYRAAVRAKVAAMAASDDEIELHQRQSAGASAQRHLDLAIDLLQPTSQQPAIAMCGPVGSGKSTLAKYLARRIDGIRISSDRLRKSMAGAQPHDRLDAAQYSWSHTEKVYQQLIEAGHRVAESGRVPVLDATFASQTLRDMMSFEDIILIWVDAPEAELKRRLEARQQSISESDAGPDLLPSSLAHFQEPLEQTHLRVLRVDSSQPDWLSQAETKVRDLLKPNI